MNIHEFLKPLGCRIMRPEENGAVLNFFNSISMASEKFAVTVKKEPDYFRFLKYAGDNCYVIGFPNAQGQLEGMVALIVRPCYIKAKPQVVGLFADLRFKRRMERTITSDWRKMGIAFIKNGKNIDELGGCHIYQGAYIATNKYATRAVGTDTSRESTPLTAKEKAGLQKREKAGDEMPFQISNLASYQAVNIYARKPHKAMGFGVSQRSEKLIAVFRGEEKDKEPLKAFLDKQNRLKTFGYIYSGNNGELERRFKNWDGFSISSFFIARDEFGKIIGTFGVFDPGKARQIYIDKIPANKAVMAKIAKMVGLKTPEANKQLEMLYLTTLELDQDLSQDVRLDVFDRLLTGLYKSGLPKDYHLISFCDYKKQSLLDVVKNSYMCDTTPVKLFQLYIPDISDVYREDQMAYPPGHEMALM